ncbi:hypothetical protein FWF48_00935 [Candidatus Saccharibacteria bacterium]|nr:hypothetical protein [Candidatus Saccharibacteria bacterium]
MRDVKDNAYILVICGVIIVVISALMLIVNGVNNAMQRVKNVEKKYTYSVPYEKISKN